LQKSCAARALSLTDFLQAQVEVEPIEPKDPALLATIKSMDERGIKTLYGRWLIDGAPRVLLFDTGTGYRWLDEWKGDLWSSAGIPSPPGDSETNEAIVFGYLIAWFLGEYTMHEKKRAIIVQFHEWLAGVAVPLCKKRRIDVTTIFTTHATLLGRYLCAGSVDFYNNLQYFDVDAEAGKRGIYHRYCIERAATHSADVFTTVSHITAYESEHLLKRKPDGVLPNGLNVKKFSATHEFQNLHQQSKVKINDFIRGHFYGHNDFDPEKTLYFFTAGRYEYRNKGVDMFIESLARLNHKMKNENSDMTVVAFIILPAQTTSLSVDSLKGQAVIKSLHDTVDNIAGNVAKKLFERSLTWTEGQELPEDKDLLSPQDKILLRRRLYAMKRHNLPPIVTHNMANDSEDPVLNQLRRCQLFNHPSDRVKVVFHPEFLNSANPVLPLDYDDFVRGTHLGVFSSYYEPWGYTPAECTVMGVPSITTNLSGFGCYMEELIENAQDYGIYIVDRRMKGVDDSVNQLVDYMFDFTRKSKRQRINQRNRTERLSDLLDWKRMGLEYVKARQLALRRAYPNAYEDDDEPDFFSANEAKISRPLSEPGSPRDRSGMMTPGDFASLQEGREGLSTEDYIAWKLPYVHPFSSPQNMTNAIAVRRRRRTKSSSSRSRSSPRRARVAAPQHPRLRRPTAPTSGTCPRCLKRESCIGRYDDLANAMTFPFAVLFFSIHHHLFYMHASRGARPRGEKGREWEREGESERERGRERATMYYQICQYYQYASANCAHKVTLF
jgi:glycogen(starch) synthase